jgi:predicted metal-dependent peptidase
MQIVNEDYRQQALAAKAKMERVAGMWMIDDTMLLGAWCLVEKQEDPKQDTIGIDSRCNPPIVKYNPYFINSLSKEKLEMVMVSEAFKILLKHPTTRLRQPRVISAMASQLVINQILNQFDKELAGEDNFLMPDDFGLMDDKFFEEYYRRLMEDLEKAMQKISLTFGNSDENKEGESQGGSGEGKGEPKDKQEQKPGNKFKEYKDEKQALKDYFNPAGTCSMEWGSNDLFDADVTNMVRERNSSKYWGKYTGDFQGMIVAANKPKVSYREVLRRFNTSVISSKEHPSRMKVNRRYDLASPGHRRLYKSKVIFAVDASGSMGDDDLAEGFAVINSVCKHSELTFILFDTEIKLVEKKIKKARKEFKVSGRGGTDFNAVCNYATEHKADGLVIFTDGQASALPQPKGVKVCWVMSDKQFKPPVNWGTICHLDRYENVH